MKLTAMLLLSLFLLASCGAEPHEAGTPVTVYLPGGPDDRAAVVEKTLYCPEGETLWVFALNGVLSGAGGHSAFPSGVTADGSALADGVANVSLSEEAAPLTGFALTQARACVVLTLTALDGVNGVTLKIEGQDAEPVLFRASDFISGSLVLADTERIITLYFIDELGERTVSETRQLVVRETDTVDWYLRYMAEEMIAGPKTAGFRPALPEGTRLLSVIVEGGACAVINFSGEFMPGAGNSGVSPRQTLNCLVRSVTSLPGVSSLRLLVDGQPLETYGGIDVSEPLRTSIAAAR
ncbi:MAG: GerMN domain-containing protein [Oscillospiraceae bacterium]|jgi:spore germination protein GerM|nr:GerMN domain-containing protein [Oscillospiraceae bacterium]